MKRFFFFLILSILPTAAWGKGCYSPQEVAAENVLRLHSEMMVIAVTCRQSSYGHDLIAAHTRWTQRFIEDIKKAEAIMINYYKKTRGGDGIAQLDDLRTKLANEFGQKSADEKPPVFCAYRRDNVMALYNSPALSAWDTAMRLYEGAPTFDPICLKRP